MTPTHRTTRSRLARLTAVALGTLLSAAAAPDTVADRVASLEERLAALEAENVLLRNQIGATETPPAPAPTGAGMLVLGGFIHAQFESGGRPDVRYQGINDRFLLRRARLNLAVAPLEHIGFKFEADFGNNAIGARNGASGQITDAYVAYAPMPAAGLRLGQFKTPFGYEQLLPDTRILAVERSLPNDRLTLGRQIGAMLHGEVLGRRVTYAVGAFNGSGTNQGNNDNDKFLWVGRTAAVVHEGTIGAAAAKLTVGANGFTTEDKGTNEGRRTGLGVDVQVTVGPAELQAEWLSMDEYPVFGRETAADGWALLGAISLTTTLQGVARYESYESTAAVPSTRTGLWTFGCNYRLKGDDLKLTLNYLVAEAPAAAAGRLLGRLQLAF